MNTTEARTLAAVHVDDRRERLHRAFFALRALDREDRPFILKMLKGGTEIDNVSINARLREYESALLKSYGESPCPNGT